MDGKFSELPEEKRQKIINAGFEVFAGNDYKRASTERIAALAGISKGLLFYYFKNKKALYLYLYGYAEKLITRFVLDKHFFEITDFFELCTYSVERKYALLERNPYIMDFTLRAFYSRKEDVSPELDKEIQEKTDEMYRMCFSRIDLSKFRPEVDPHEIYNVIVWVSDGYLHERQRMGLAVDYREFMEKCQTWMTFLKKTSYREEYLDGSGN